MSRSKTPAFSAPEYKDPNDRAMVIGRGVMLRSYPDRGPAWDDRLVDRWEDGVQHAEMLAAKEGYRLVRAEMYKPQLDNQFLFTVKMVVERAYPQNQVPGCKGCDPENPRGFYPPHYPNAYCRSGKRPHCTCDGVSDGNIQKTPTLEMRAGVFYYPSRGIRRNGNHSLLTELGILLPILLHSGCHDRQAPVCVCRMTDQLESSRPHP